LENTTYLLSKVSLRESDRALDTYSQWEKHFDIFIDEKAASDADKSVFLEQLPSLNSQLRRLYARLRLC
jgi:hypothetical protein